MRKGRPSRDALFVFVELGEIRLKGDSWLANSDATWFSKPRSALLNPFSEISCAKVWQWRHVAHSFAVEACLNDDMSHGGG
jgi:hypothetical protein